MIELPRIPREEYPQRLERLRVLMKAAGLEGTLLTTGMNLAYFSGYPSPVRNVARPFFVLLPLSGDPVFFTQYGHKEEAERYSWIKDVRYYTELSHAPISMIRDALREREIFGTSIGMELGFEQTLDISHLEFCRLRDGLDPTRLVDASTMFWELRKIKSEAEIGCIRKACQITNAAYEATFSSASVGSSELQIFRTMQGNLHRGGGGAMFLSITSGKDNYDLVTKQPDDRPLQPGDMVWMDAGCTVCGYWSDFSRGAVVGRPSAEQAHAQEAIHQITWEAVQMVRPGVPASTLARFCYSRLDQLPFPITSSIARRAERVGHGVGLVTTEPPHIAEYDDTPLEPGMIITLEPGVATEYGTFNIEENLLVTPEGNEVLSQVSRALHQLPIG
jgi:Xaa-Pro aminopeptidase